MKNNAILKIYALAVCFTSLMCGAISSGFLIFNIIKFVAPQTAIDPSTLALLQSTQAFKSSMYNPNIAQPVPLARFSAHAGVLPPVMPVQPNTQQPPLDSAALEKLRLQQLQNMIDRQRFQARQSLIMQTIIVFITSILFYAHWRLYHHTVKTDE